MRGRELAVAVVALAGCDSVFGLTYKPKACVVPGFDGADATTIATPLMVDLSPPVNPDLFSVSWDETIAVVDYSGIPYEIALPGGMPVKIDLGVYPSNRFSLAPEGDVLLYSASEEPPILQSARRSGPGAWSAGGDVPIGAYAGTPSAAEFGPPRVLVRLRDAQPEVQEYESDGTRWVAIGGTQKVDGAFGPNLTPDGLTMSYDVAGTTFAATRATRADWFGTAAPTSTGGHAQPQLLDSCHHLFTLDSDNNVRRYDR